MIKLIYKNRNYTDKANDAHQLNTPFFNVGPQLTDKPPPTNESVEQYIKRLSEIVFPYVVFLSMKFTI